jgi:tRNA-guanine family transglycosylase
MTFEITHRAAAGRVGRLATAHGTVTTPNLMPVVNPNIDLVSPREMRDRFGCEMVITNSYVIHKHEALRERALADGVHAVLDWDGAVMTDSGTFQMYVYGDVEVAPDEIVRFQRDIGVDVATCLDLFVTPDADRRTAEHAVATTVDRTRAAVEHKGKTLLNATVQGGVHLDLRKDCAAAYRDLGVDYHTIGGVVPVMERQMYPELAEMILWSQQALRKDRPLHLFGAGHPLVFPLAVALGCDLFDSSSYAKYAKDGRIITPTGTLHVADLAESREGTWPFATRFLDAWTPREWMSEKRAGKAPRETATHASMQTATHTATDSAMRAATDTATDSATHAGTHTTKDTAAGRAARGRRSPRTATEAERALALHNLDVCFTDIRGIRHAIRDGVLWELVEQRAAAHPLLAAATRRLGRPEYQAWLEAREPTSGARALRYTGALTHGRPIFARIRHRLCTRFTPVGVPVAAAMTTAYADEGEEKREAAMHKEPTKPYGAALGTVLDAQQDHVVMSALGPVPLGLDEAYPFAQSVLPRLEDLDRGHMGWVGQTKDAFLAAHAMMPAIPGPPGPGGPLDRDRLQVLRTADWQFGAGAGAAFTASDFRCQRSRRTGKMRTVERDGEHVLSLRAEDGLWTLKAAGARLLHSALAAPANRVVVASDTAQFNRAGKSVFAKFVVAMDAGLRPGDECLVVDESDGLVAVGRVLLQAEEAADFRHGLAVKVREGMA